MQFCRVCVWWLGGLRENAGAVGKCITNWRSKLPKYLTKGFFELIVDYHMLIDAEIGGGKLGKGRDAEVGIFIPVRRRHIGSLWPLWRAQSRV